MVPYAIMKRTLYEDLRAMIAAGRQFSDEEISIIKSSQAYLDCSFTERAFIDVLFNRDTEINPHRDTSAGE
jgi:hypothetical protein